jgi:DNA-binding NarL/FixJ family response regulator
VAVVDDCTLTRTTFQNAYPALDVISVHAAIDDLLSQRPSVDLVVLDLMLDTALHCSDTIQGPSAVEALAQQGYRVCVYTSEQRPLVLAQCLSRGATGIVRKCDPLEVNQNMLVAVASGQTRIATPLCRTIDAIQRRGGPPVLTVRQRQVVYARARGASWQAIADDLGISTKTAYDRLEAARIKLSGFLDIIDLDPDCTPTDIERAIAHTPDDLVAIP